MSIDAVQNRANHEGRRAERARERQAPVRERTFRMDRAAWEDRVIHRRAQENKQAKAHARAVKRRERVAARNQGILQSHIHGGSTRHKVKVEEGVQAGV